MTSAVPGAAVTADPATTPTPLLRVDDLGIRHDGADAAAPASVVRDLLAWALTDADADLVADLVRALERADSDEFAEEIATLRGLSLEEVASATTENFLRLFPQVREAITQ